MSKRRNENKKLQQKRRRTARLVIEAKRATSGRATLTPRAYPALPLRVAPSILDQMGVFIAEPELGRPSTTLPTLRKLAAQLPFEPAMLHVAILTAQLEPVLDDPAGQWHLGKLFFGDRPDLLSAYVDVLRQHPSRLVFSPQALILLMRVLIDFAADAPLRDLAAEEITVLQDAVLGAHSALESSLDGSALPNPELVLAFELQGATFFRRPQLLEEITTHQTLLDVAVSDPRVRNAAARPPVVEWLTQGTQGLTPEQQFSLGFGLAAMTHSFSKAVKPRVLAAHAADLVDKQGIDATRATAAMSATRTEFQALFTDDSPSSMRWELRPFKSRPFLRLGNGDLLLLSPTFILSWLGEGFHYRTMTYAQSLGDRDLLRYTTFVGHVVERHALDLAEAAATTQPVEVSGEQPYNKGQDATSDVAMICGDDLILFEVHARRVAAVAAVKGTPEAATTEVSRMLVEKTDQIGTCIAALLDDRAHLPGLDIASIKRIWPVVVSVGHVMQTPTLWDYVRAKLDKDKTASFSHDRVQPLQIFDFEDYEKALAFVELGENLPDLLARKTSGPYRERDWSVWLHEDRSAPSDQPRLSVLKDRFREVSDRVIEATRRAEEVGQSD